MGGQQQCSPPPQLRGHPLSWHLGVPALSPGTTRLGSAAVQLGLILTGAGDPGEDDSLVGCSVLAQGDKGRNTSAPIWLNSLLAALVLPPKIGINCWARKCR